MVHRFLRKLLRRRHRSHDSHLIGARAGACYDDGLNCTQAVLQAHLGSVDPQMMAVGAAFGAGVGGSKCLCGAVTGGVIVLSLKGRGELAGELVKRFRAKNKVTCCKALSAPYRWKSAEHLANCRRLTIETAEEVERLLEE